MAAVIYDPPATAPPPAGGSVAISVRRPTAIELFCGAGGMTLGFEAAGFDVLLSADNDPLHLATHEWNFPQTYVDCADLADIDHKRLASSAEKQWRALYPDDAWPEDIDCVFGGPSCQGFSEIGRRNPLDDRNLLLSAFARAVSVIRPRYFVMENVPGMLDPRNSSTVSAALDLVEAAGYTLWADGMPVLNAADYGVPQLRRRVFIVGARAGESLPLHPQRSDNRVTVRDAIDDLCHLERYTSLYRTDEVRLTDHGLRAISGSLSEYARRIGAEPGSHGAWALAYPRPHDRSLMTSSGRTIHAETVVRRFAETPHGSEEPVSRLPRLDPSGCASTLRAGTGRDHGSFTSARPIHYRYPRVITVREAARLHSFPDWFRFHATKWHGFRQVGNAVPPLLAKAVADSIVAALAVRPPAPDRTMASNRPQRLLTYSLTEAAEYYGVAPALLPKDSRR